MEKAEIIKGFLNKGYQLDAESLEYFQKNEGKIGQFMDITSKTESSIPTIITIDVVKMKLGQNEGKYRIEVLRDFKRVEGVISVANSINFIAKKYEKMKKFLLNRLDLVNLISVNKLSSKTKKFSLIVIVKEKNEGDKSLVVEDSTGELSVFIDKKIIDNFYAVVPDEILGLVCEKEGDTVYVKNIIFPDIPLNRDINATKEDVFCLFISDIHMDDKDFNKKGYEKFLDWTRKVDYDKFYIFALGGISKNSDDVSNFFNSLPKGSYKVYLKSANDPNLEVGDLTVNDPSLIKIEGKLNFLISHSINFANYQSLWSDLTPQNILLNLLKKRHLNPIFDKNISEDDPYVLDVVPDVFASGYFQYPSYLNYKGTTLITTGSFLKEPVFWLLNLKTREVIKLDFT